MQVKTKYPHRLVLQTDTDDESVPGSARQASASVAAAFERYKNTKLGRNPHLGIGELPESVRDAFHSIRDGIADCCAVGAAEKDSSFWDVPGDFFSAFEKDMTAVVCLCSEYCPFLPCCNV